MTFAPDRQPLNGVSQPSRFLIPNGECFGVDAAIAPISLQVESHSLYLAANRLVDISTRT
jgi:hypothetical protein